jgi:hypothetical protein
MIFDDEILQVTFCGNNPPGKVVCRCHHPFRTDDGATAAKPIIPMYILTEHKSAERLHLFKFCIRSVITTIQNVLQTSSKQTTHINGMILV